MADDWQHSLAQAGPYVTAEMAAERMGVAMLTYFAEEAVDDEFRPLNGATILRGHVAGPQLYGKWGATEEGKKTLAQVRAGADRVIVLGTSWMPDPDGGPEAVELEFIIETSTGMGAEANRLEVHEERVAAVRGILSSAGRAGTVAIAAADAGDTNFTVRGWQMVPPGTTTFEGKYWTTSMPTRWIMELSGPDTSPDVGRALVWGNRLLVWS